MNTKDKLNVTEDVNTKEKEKKELYEKINFDMKLFMEIFEQEKGKNILISAYSIYMALSLLANGATGITQMEIIKMLCANNENGDEIDINKINNLMNIKNLMYVKDLMDINKLTNINQINGEISEFNEIKDFTISNNLMNISEINEKILEMHKQIEELNTTNLEILNKNLLEINKQILETEDPQVEIKIANSIWIKKGYKPSECFNKTTNL